MVFYRCNKQSPIFSKLRDRVNIISDSTICEDNEPSRFVLAQKSIWRMSIIEERYDFPQFMDYSAVIRSIIVL